MYYSHQTWRPAVKVSYLRGPKKADQHSVTPHIELALVIGLMAINVWFYCHFIINQGF